MVYVVNSKPVASIVKGDKAQKPKVKVYNQKGALISSKYYKVTYRKNKEIGNATADIKFSGKYYGTITMKFQVVPKSTSLTKLTKVKKKYYVRVRTYKTVKIVGRDVKIYSGWSKYKTITTK